MEFTCELRSPLAEVWQFHNRIESLFLLTPPQKHARLLSPPDAMRTGAVYKIQVLQFGLIPVRIWSEIIQYTPPAGFIDRQVPGHGPFAYWTHEHRFTAITSETTLLTDIVDYQMPFGRAGALVNSLLVQRDIERMFAYRHQITRSILEAP